MKKRFGRSARSYIKLAGITSALLVLCGLVSIFTDYSLTSGVVGVISGLAVLILTLINENRKFTSSDKLINGKKSYELMNSLPMPIVSAYADGTVKWYNDKFSDLFNRRNMKESVIETIIPNINWSEILRSGNGITKEVVINERTYDLETRIVKDTDQTKSNEYYIYIYLMDKTERLQAIKAYQDEKTDVGVICIDNYDEIFQRMNDVEQQKVLASLRSIINNWAQKSNAVLKKIDRDRYYIFFAHQYLDMYIRDNFDILEKVRKVGEEVKQPVSVSIGIGTGSSLSENEQAARTALDMSQGRGGDQVGLKDDTQYHFYGAKNREYEKSTRVKTRAVAAALVDYIKGADNVIFVGHSNIDYDAFGAAMGLQRAVREFGKKPYIVHDSNFNAVRKLYDEVVSNEEYEGMFVEANEINDYLTKSTLIVVLDTHRPTMLQVPNLVKNASKVVLIDHHRRSTEFIENCSLIYHEPYASSTCEMVTELLQYMPIGSAVTALEAECLYTGILLDTKNFIVKTGVRTFEAASYLRRRGLNTFGVKKLFNVEKDEYDKRAEIVKTAVEVAPNFSVAYTNEPWPNIRVIAAQAADEMLNINSVCASFVIYPDEGKVSVSARSLSDVNVHQIMESMGGGGHATVAGTQKENMTVDEVKEELVKAINDYISTAK